MLKNIAAGLALASVALAHHTLEGWDYYGCADVNPASFDSVVSYVTGYTPEQCQGACAGYKYAGVYFEYAAIQPP
jgi:hypothetical protein